MPVFDWDLWGFRCQEEHRAEDMRSCCLIGSSSSRPASLAMAFQLRWPSRFNLRSLFVVTTFLAVVLGMIAWLDRAWIGK